MSPRGCFSSGQCLSCCPHVSHWLAAALGAGEGLLGVSEWGSFPPEGRTLAKGVSLQQLGAGVPTPQRGFEGAASSTCFNQPQQRCDRPSLETPPL